MDSYQCGQFTMVVGSVAKAKVDIIPDPGIHESHFSFLMLGIGDFFGKLKNFLDRGFKI